MSGSFFDAYRRQAADPSAPEHWSGPPGMVERIAATAGTTAEHLVLDVGCGIGGPARRLAAAVGCDVVGVDVVHEVVRAARERTSSRPAPGEGRVRFAVASATSLPIRSGSVDQAWSLGTVAHLGDRAAFARELERVLVPGGVAVVTEAFAAPSATSVFESANLRPWHPVTVDELVAHLRAAGFEDVAEEAWPGAGLEPERDVGHEALARDFAEGRLVSRMVLARTRPQPTAPR